MDIYQFVSNIQYFLCFLLPRNLKLDVKSGNNERIYYFRVQSNSDKNDSLWPVIDFCVAVMVEQEDLLCRTRSDIVTRARASQSTEGKKYILICWQLFCSRRLTTARENKFRETAAYPLFICIWTTGVFVYDIPTPNASYINKTMTPWWNTLTCQAEPVFLSLQE